MSGLTIRGLDKPMVSKKSAVSKPTVINQQPVAQIAKKE
jgi:hypothetical protein